MGKWFSTSSPKGIIMILAVFVIGYFGVMKAKERGYL